MFLKDNVASEGVLDPRLRNKKKRTNLLMIIKTIKKIFKDNDIVSKKLTLKQVDKNILQQYNNSLGWYVTCIIDEGRQPDGVIYIGTVDTEEIIEIVYRKSLIDIKSIISFLMKEGIQLQSF